MEWAHKLSGVAQTIAESRWARWIRRHRESCLLFLFVVVALVESLCFSRMLPLGQVPDEFTHYQLMEEEFGTTGYVDEMFAFVYYPSHCCDLPTHPEIKVDREALASVSEVRFTSAPGLGAFHPNLHVVRHLPAGLGFYIGAMLNLPILTCTYLAELGSLLFFVIMGYLTIRTTPIKKEIFAFCMLIPLTLQQCASINYDAIVIPCSFLLFAYILRLYYSEKKVGWGAIAVVLLLTAVIGLTKPPYVLIALAMLIIPFSRYQLKIGKKWDLAAFARKYWYATLALVIVVAALALYKMRNMYEIRTLISDILALPAFYRMLQDTYEALGFYHIHQMVGNFGWLDSQVSTGFIIAFFIMMTYLNATRTERVSRELNFPRRAWLLFLSITIFFLIEVTLQAWCYKMGEWDILVPMEELKSYIPNLGIIQGVQGRYWIPFLPMILVALSGKIRRRHLLRYYAVQAAYYLITFLIVMDTLNVRYWVQ